MLFKKKKSLEIKKTWETNIKTLRKGLEVEESPQEKKMENERKYRSSTSEFILEVLQRMGEKNGDIFQEKRNFPVTGQKRLQIEPAFLKSSVQGLNKRPLCIHIFLQNFNILS